MSARDYAKVLPSFWTGRTGREIRRLGPWAQVVAVYLLTSPHSSATGHYHLSIGYLCADTGCPIEGASKVLRSLSEVGFAHYDEATETVWIPEMARHQIGPELKAGDNRVSWVVKTASAMRNRPYFQDFMTKYQGAYHLPDIESDSPSEAPPKPLRSLELETELERETELELALVAPPAKAGKKSRKVDDRTSVALADPDVVRLLAVYRELHGKDDRWSSVAIEEGRPRAVRVYAALRGENGDRLTPEEIELAFRGNAAAKWCIENGKHEIVYILRGENVHRFIADGRRLAGASSAPVKVDPQAEAIAAAERALDEYEALRKTLPVGPERDAHLKTKPALQMALARARGVL